MQKSTCVFAFGFLAFVISVNILRATIIDVPEPGGASSFSVDGTAFAFPYFSNLVYAKCPNPVGLDPVSCYASFSEVYAQEGDGPLGEGDPAALSAGDQIDSLVETDGELFGVSNLPYDTYGVSGEFRSQDPNNPDYLGFAVEASDGVHYGWAIIDISGFVPSPDDPSNHLSASVMEYAYESCPDTYILAGESSGGAACDDPPTHSAVPEPPTALLLVIGFASLGIYWNRVEAPREFS